LVKRITVLMQFVCTVGFDWLLFYVKFSIYKSKLRGPAICKT
jgi:hypothetical protein